MEKHRLINEKTEPDDLAAEFGDEEVEELSVIAEVAVLVPDDSSSSPGSDSSSAVSTGSTPASGVSSSLTLEVGGDSPVVASPTAPPPPAASGTPQTVPSEKASAQFQSSEEAASSRAASFFGIPESGKPKGPVTTEDVQAILRAAIAQGIPNPGALHMRFTDDAPGSPTVIERE